MEVEAARLPVRHQSINIFAAEVTMSLIGIFVNHYVTEKVLGLSLLFLIHMMRLTVFFLMALFHVA